MPSDASIYSNALQPLRSAVDYANDFAKADAMRNANALQAFNLGQAANVNSQKNALRTAIQGGNVDLTTDAGQGQALAVAPDVAPGLIKTVQDSVTSRAAAQKDLGAANASNATAGKTIQDTQVVKHDLHLRALDTVTTPEQGMQWLADGLSSGAMSPSEVQRGLANLSAASQTQGGFEQWKDVNKRGGLSILESMNQTKPNPQEVRLGNIVKTIDTNPYSSTFGKEVVSQQAIGISPDTEATQAGENARAAALRQTQLQIAGMGPNGQISPQLEAEAQMIAAGRAAPPSGMAATRPAAAALMARVSQINPDYDATTYGAKVKAAKDFTTGPQGNQMRAFQVASDHLDQLQMLATALKNGNFQLVNQIGNAYGVQAGQAPAAVFNAVRQLVGPEITSAIVLGGGSAHERDQAAATFSPNSSPDQFLGTIGATRDLMKAKYSAMLAQRRAAGVPDSTLPGYGGGHGSAQGAGGGVQLPTADAIAAELARRGGQ